MNKDRNNGEVADVSKNLFPTHLIVFLHYWLDTIYRFRQCYPFHLKIHDFPCCQLKVVI